jgi:hypothetical protein
MQGPDVPEDVRPWRDARRDARRAIKGCCGEAPTGPQASAWPCSPPLAGSVPDERPRLVNRDRHGPTGRVVRTWRAARLCSWRCTTDSAFQRRPTCRTTRGGVFSRARGRCGSTKVKDAARPAPADLLAQRAAPQPGLPAHRPPRGPGVRHAARGLRRRRRERSRSTVVVLGVPQRTQHHGGDCMIANEGAARGSSRTARKTPPPNADALGSQPPSRSQVRPRPTRSPRGLRERSARNN